MAMEMDTEQLRGTISILSRELSLRGVSKAVLGGGGGGTDSCSRRR